MMEDDSFRPINITSDMEIDVLEYETKPFVRQRSSKNPHKSSTAVNPTPITPETTNSHDSAHQFSFVCKRITHVVVCASLYIVLFSSHGTNVKIDDADTRFISQQNHRKDGENLRKKSKSRPLNPIWNQIPIPDFDFLNSSSDDGGDDSGEDDNPDDGVGKAVKNAINSLDNVKDIHSNRLTDQGGHDPKKKLKPSLAFAKSFSSSLIEGAPKPKFAQNSIIYRHRNNSNGIHEAATHNDGHLRKKINSQDQGLLNFRVQNFWPNLKQTGATPLYDSKLSENENDHENVVNIGGETTNKITICLAWLCIVLFMMEAGYREIKRRIRSLKVKQFLEYVRS